MTQPQFNEFWAAYPRHVSKKKAMARYLALPEIHHGTIMKALEEQKRLKQWQDKQYIPHAATWLNQQRWEDEYEADDSVANLKVMSSSAKVDWMNQNPGEADKYKYEYHTEWIKHNVYLQTGINV